MLWLAVAITLVAATSSAIGKALQKQSTTSLPRFSLDRVVVRQYFSSRTWLLGVVADVLGGIIQIGAFALAPVSVVQPVGGVGLVGLSFYSHFAAGERLTAWEWSAAALAGAGTLALGAGSSGDGGEPPSVRRALGVLLILASATGAWVALPARAGAATGSTQRRRGTRAGRGALLGLQAGTCFGLSAACCRTGFLFAARWPPAAAAGLVASLACSSGGFALQTLGLKDGATVLVCTAAAVGAMLSGVLVGTLALGERLPAGGAARAVRLAGWLAVAAGVSGLSAGERGAAQAIDALAKSHRWRVAVPARARQWAVRRLASLPETASHGAMAAAGGAHQAVTHHQKV